MKKKIYLISLILSFFLLSCEKDEPVVLVETDATVDFVYTISQNDNSFRVCAADASNNVPSDCTYKWNFPGASYTDVYDKYNVCGKYHEPGNFAIVLLVTTPEGKQFSKSYSFELAF